jgi:hypothetical protein
VSIILENCQIVALNVSSSNDSMQHGSAALVYL